MASLTNIAADIGSVVTWFFTNTFTSFFNVIQSNDLILWPVVFAIVAGVVGGTLKVIRKFGVKGRR